MKKNDVIDPDRNWKHFVHDVDPLDEKATVCRFVFAKYDKSIDSPSWTICHTKSTTIQCGNTKQKQKRKKLHLNGRQSIWEPSRVMWKWFSHRTDSHRQTTLPFTVAEYEHHHSSRTIK